MDRKYWLFILIAFGLVGVTFANIPNNTISHNEGGALPLFNATGDGYWVDTVQVIDDDRNAYFQNLTLTGPFLNGYNLKDTFGMQPYAYIVDYNATSGLYQAKNGDNGTVDFSGTDADTIINAAFNGLTVGRTWQEKVLVKGNFTINNRLEPGNYTIIELDGSVRLADGSNCALVYCLNKEYISIIGGYWDGNKAGQTGLSGHINLAHTSYSLVRDIHIINAWEHSIMVHQTKSYYNMIFRNRVEGGTETLIKIEGGAHDNYVEYNTVLNNSVESGIGVGTGGDTASINNIITNNICSGNGGHGIWVPVPDNTITNNICKFNTLSGIVSHSRSVVTGNTCNNNGQYGISVTGSGASVTNNIVFSSTSYNIYVTGSYNTINGNNIYNGTTEGMRITGHNNTINNNIVYDNSQGNPNNAAGIMINGGKNNIITGNRCFDTENILASKTQRGGIQENGVADYNIITNNNVYGCRTFTITVLGSNTIAKNNQGYTGKGDIRTNAGNLEMWNSTAWIIIGP